MNRALAFLVLAGAMLPLYAAHADPLVISALDPAPMAGNNSVYVTMGGGAVVQAVPTWNTPYAAVGSTPIYSSGASVTGGAGALTIGTKLPGATFGTNTRIEFSIGGFGGNTTITGGQGVNTNTNLFPISGATGGSCGICDGTTTVKINHQEIGGVIRLKSDYSFGPQWMLTPSVGLLASHSRTGYRSDTQFYYGQPGLAPPAWVDEKLYSFRTGAELGLNLSYQATQALSFNAGMALSLMAMTTSLRGNDCMSFNQSSALPCSGAYYATSVSATDTRFAVRDRFSLSGTYNAGWARLSLAGFATWDSAMAGVTNPTTAGTPATIKYESKWGYGGAGMVTVPF